MKKQIFWLFGAVFLFGCAMQHDVNSLNNHLRALSQQNFKLEQRIIELERQRKEWDRQMQTLKQGNVEMESWVSVVQKKEAENSQQLRDQLAGLRVALTDVRQEIQTLTGKSEFSEHWLKQKSKDVEALDKKLENRLTYLEENSTRDQERISRVEQYLNLDSAQKKSVSGGAQGSEAKAPSDEGLYNRAKQSFDKGDLEVARKGFQELLDKYPQSNLANNAQFWIGEIYYREKWYEKAILEYQKVIENYPQGNKVPAALLKQSFAFLNIKDEANARLVLRELVNKYPKSNEAEIAGKKLDELK